MSYNLFLAEVCSFNKCHMNSHNMLSLQDMVKYGFHFKCISGKAVNTLHFTTIGDWVLYNV